MAGAGYKLFNTGDVLTAAQVNTYLQEQVVMVFADAAARTTALSGVLAEGMISYLKDTDAVEKYNGSSWVSVGGSASPLTTKGDLYTYSTADARLGVGTNGQVLTADSSTATGLKWATAAGGGKVLQVVSSVYSTATTVSSTSFTDSGLSASITPAAASSKILVIVSQQGLLYRNGTSCAGALRIVRGSTAVFAGTPAYEYQMGTSIGWRGRHTLVYLDSPSTTSATTYKTQGKIEVVVNDDKWIFQDGSAESSITLLEIGA